VSGKRVLEFERADRLGSSELMKAVVTNFVGKLGNLKTEMGSLSGDYILGSGLP
jgi:hypothetical protein